MKHLALFLTALLSLLFYSCSPVQNSVVEPMLRTYHDPSFGWTASIPSDWFMCYVPGGQFARGLPLTDPTKLLIWSYKNKFANDIRVELETFGGVINQVQVDESNTTTIHWTRYRGDARSDPALTVEFALGAKDGDTHLVLLVARRSEKESLTTSVLLPAIESFVPGSPDKPVSALAVAPPEPDYLPTHGWRTASPESQGMDAQQLKSMLALIKQESIPLDSLTIVRHGYLILDETFPPFEPTDLHELHSATKSVTSALVGMALYDAQTAGNKTLSVNSPLSKVLSSHQAQNMDDRKRAITMENVLTMTTGLDWSEWDAPYEPGTGNDLVLMIDTSEDWTQYVLDQPMTSEPGTTFLYNSGASHLLSAVVTELKGLPAADFAAERLFSPLGITDFDWAIGPEGVTAGWANLRMHPKDLARIGLLYLHHGKWGDKQIIPIEWVKASTTDHVSDPLYEYGYQWWLDVADQYAFMAGRFGQVAIVAPRQDMVIVFTSHLPDTVSDVTVIRWLTEKFIFPAAN